MKTSIRRIQNAPVIQMKTETFFRNILTAVLFAVFFINTPSMAELSIMPISDVTIGMKGVARTVFRGTQSKTFPVEIMGVLPGGGPGGGDLVLIQVSGPDIEAVGGIALGMSGSPVYVKGKLIGAVSIAFPESDGKLGGVTAIQDMLDTYDFLDKPDRVELDTPLHINGKEYSAIDYTESPAAPGVLKARTALCPVAIRGLSERSYKTLEPLFKENGLQVLPFEGMAGVSSAGANDIIASGKDLRPGDSIAVQLVRGDLDISAVGTLTAVDGNRILAFGHHFFRKGDVDYLMADAPVLAILNSNAVPYKITTTGAVRGSFTQDRGNAMLGAIDIFPTLIPVSITVEDTDVGRRRQFHTRIVKDKDLLPQLIISVLIDAIDKTIDRFGPGSASVDFHIKADGVKTDIQRGNSFYSGYDISAEAIRELMMALQILQENFYQESRILSLEATVKIDTSESMASIVEAELFDPVTGEPLAKSEEKDISSKDENSEESESDEIDDEDLDFNDDDFDDFDEDDLQNNNKDDDAGEFKSEDQSEELEEIETEETLDDIESDDEEETGRKTRERKSRKRRKKLQSVTPGQKLGLKIKIRPFKKEPIEEKLYIKVPHDINKGPAVIRIFSGMKYMYPWYGGFEGMLMGDVFMEDIMEPEHGLRDSHKDDEDKKTLDDIIKKFLERDRNNELVATITSMSAAPRDDDYDDEEYEDDEDYERDRDEEDVTDIEGPPPDRAKKATTWVLGGGSSIRVRVVDESGTSDLKSGRIEKSKIKALEGSDQ